MTPHGIDEETLEALLNAFGESDWEQMAVSIDGDTLQISRGTELPPLASADSPTGAPASVAREASAAAAPEPAAPLPDTQEPSGEGATGLAVTSPTVGIFWRAPAPGEPPFVEVGARVEEGDTIGIVEVMKLMNHVSTDIAGTVTEILVGNGDPVEFGQDLIRVEP